MKTFDEFLTEGKKGKEKMLRLAFIQGNKNSETTIAFNPSVINKNSPTTTAVTPAPQKQAKKVARVLLQNQVEEELTSFKMAPSHTAYNKQGKLIRVPKGKAVTVSRSSSKGD